MALTDLFKRRPSWDGLASEKALTGSADVVSAIRDGGWQPYPLLGGGSRQRIQEVYNAAKSANYAWMYRRSPAVRTVIDCMVRNLGQLDLRLYEEVSEAEREARPEHPAALSLRYPNEETTGAKFRRSLFKDFLITDDAFAVMMPASGRQITLQWVPAHMVEVVGDTLFKAEAYRVHRQDGTWVEFQPENVLHWHGENPEDPRIGLSHLETLRDVVAEDAALQQAIVELANSGMTEPTWVFRPAEAPEWSNEARQGFEQDLTNRIRRRNRTPVVMEEGMELRSFGVSPKDAEMMEIRRWAIGQVAREYGVPLGMVGLDDNADEARSQFYADVLQPLGEDFTRTLDQRILVRAYNWTSGTFELNFDEKHMGDDRIKALVSATGRPVLLTNEARAMLNQPPVDGGDELVTPSNVTVGEKPSVDVMPIQDPNGPPQDGSFRRDDEAKAIAAHTESLKAVTERLQQLHPGRKVELERQHKAIDQFQGVVQRHYNRLGRALGEKSARKADGRRMNSDWKRWDRELSDDLHSALERVVEAEGGIYALKLGGDGFNMDRVRNYLRAMAEGASEALNSTIRDEIDRDGVETALGAAAKHVESAGASLGARATIWAREEAARQAPGTEQRTKSWIANTKRHGAHDGSTVALGDLWPAGFAPGTTPGCRCSMSIQ